MPKRLLILGGTGEARKLADRLLADGHDVTSSLAGVTSKPAVPVGKVVSGGFGGVEGLVEFLKAEAIDLVVDATHPYAAVIGRSAVEACERQGIKLLRLEKPAWKAKPGDLWYVAADVAEAVARVHSAARALLTIGRKDVELFSARTDINVIARMVEPPQFEVPDNWRIILAQPPFTARDEVQLMRVHDVTVLVSKNAGGPNRAKLDAARELGLPVIMIKRPGKPPAPVLESVELVAAVMHEEG